MIIKTAERIRELREKNDFTQSELARRLYVTRSSVNAWEMAISIPSTEKITELCQVLHTSSDYLLGLSSEEVICLNQYSFEEKEILYRLMKYFDEVQNQSKVES
ncbi:MAG: helix-turn-helix transcriptional regulator [Eubacteriales bacterium]|nr:helix-turn-helix transcriptional regulator [Eubacteriales bacterium]